MTDLDIKNLQQYSTDDLREHMRLRDAEYRKSITIASDGRSYLDFVEWQQDAAVIEANIEERLKLHLDRLANRNKPMVDTNEEFFKSFRGRQEE